MKKVQDRKDKFIIARVTEKEKKKVEISGKNFKDTSQYIRHKLGLDE